MGNTIKGFYFVVLSPADVGPGYFAVQTRSRPFAEAGRR